MSLEQLNSQQPLENVRFDYDSSDLGDAARASLQKNAAWMHPAASRSPTSASIRLTPAGQRTNR